MSSKDGVLLTAHGTVESLDDLPQFLSRIRRGRPAPAGLVEELRHRYERIGGSPLLRITGEQAELLSASLGLPVYLGMRLWRPELSEALTRARQEGIERLCVLPLAPFSVHVYVQAAEQALAQLGGPPPKLVGCPPFGRSPGFVQAWADAISAHERPEPGTELILTAHSLPTAIVRAGDPYQTEVEACARALGGALGRTYRLAYQSQGADGGDWLGPDLPSTLRACRENGARRVLLAPIGFLSDHVETLYDLDVEARAQARELGLDFSRVPALNTSPSLISALSDAARAAFLS
ncbi:MAG TPA: ferrochelatase [Polyangiaceae bacterium]|nr:ferrochelatase [Polyangiaceae bacterium]